MTRRLSRVKFGVKNMDKETLERILENLDSLNDYYKQIDEVCDRALKIRPETLEKWITI